jgi:hypothetical protein
MSGRAQVSPDDFEPEDTAQISETMSAEEKLEWQAELDSALAQIDSRLRNPRRRATDDPQAPLPEREQQAELSGEMLDQIARKVAEHLRRAHVVSLPGAVAKETSGPPARTPARTRTSTASRQDGGCQIPLAAVPLPAVRPQETAASAVHARRSRQLAFATAPATA